MSRRKKKKSLSKLFLISDPEKYAEIQQQKIQMKKESISKQSPKSSVSIFLQRYVELLVKHREWCIDMVDRTKDGRDYNWNKWIVKRQENYLHPLKWLSNEQKQFEKIKDQRISDGIKILKKEQILLDTCIGEYLLTNKNEYIWN
eukprot:364415_1